MSNMIVLAQPKISQFEACRFQRVAVSLHGRYMLRSRHEYPCRTFEMSPGDVLLYAPVKAVVGEQVVLYLDALGRFTGVALQETQTGFEMAVQLSQKKRDRLADQLTWFANRHALDLPEKRRHERFVPLMQLTVMRLPFGQEHFVKISSLSLSGVAIETDFVPAIGTRLAIGSTPATVVRHFEDGIACEFVTQFKVGEIDESVRL
jgi:PilZ domain